MACNKIFFGFEESNVGYNTSGVWETIQPLMLEVFGQSHLRVFITGE